MTGNILGAVRGLLRSISSEVGHILLYNSASLSLHALHHSSVLQMFERNKILSGLDSINLPQFEAITIVVSSPANVRDNKNDACVDAEKMSKECA